jgi:5-(carboxyamino)imidazole ribonucleotide mutase
MNIIEIDNPVNPASIAALLAAAVLALNDEALADRLVAWRAAQASSVALRPVDEA